ncbi:PIN domain-containing protein [Planococcus sp. N028]|uniref:PIN domain-containing protein n=1 Tax=Planococcus shixiaomingii TaxID=3058393 RepID=A0ABT8N006_9BACL|nr:PIN domain-containing protein [Planococcus sp. N028]MDN7241195.1 PIN domain-containing protein [Planococcus sp. N028]
MNIFIDSNVFWKDPFLDKGKNKILRMLANHKDVKLYINKTVYDEVFRGHKNYLDDQIKFINESYKKIRPYLKRGRDTFSNSISLDNLTSDFISYFDDLINEEQLEIINYDADVLAKIVEIDMNEKIPFIKKEEFVNKQQQKITIKKKEIRDAIIWYSYKTFIEKNSLENCFFISNNHTDFGAPDAKNAEKEKPYPLHSDILEGMDITAYRNAYDFLTDQDEEVKRLFKDEDLHLNFLSEIHIETIEDELRNGLAEVLIHRYLADQIHQETINYLIELNVYDIHRDYLMGGYLEPAGDFSIESIDFQEVDIYGDTITVSADIVIVTDVDIYLYNAAHDGRDDKFGYSSTDQIQVQENIIFLIPLDLSKEITKEGFSFEEYIEGTEPENLAVEIFDYNNVDHTSIFDEEHYNEEYERDEIVFKLIK